MKNEEQIKNELLGFASEEGHNFDENQELERIYFGHKMEETSGIPFLYCILRIEDSDIFFAYAVATEDVFVARVENSCYVEGVLLSDEIKIVKFLKQRGLDLSFSPFSTLFNSPKDDPNFKRLLKAC